MKRYRVLFTVNIASPYRIDFFNELGKFCDLTVLFERETASDRDASWKADTARNFHAVYLKGLRTGSDKAFCPAVVSYLRDRSFDAIVIGGYSTPTGILSVAFLRLFRRAYILNVDGGFPKNDSLIMRTLKRALILGASRYLSPSRGASEYLVHYGVPTSAIHQYPFSSVRQGDIAERPPSIEEKQRLRASLGIAEEFCVLAVGQYIHRKGFDLLIQAGATLGNEVGVYIVGGTPTQHYLDLRARCAAANVKFVDFKDSTTLKDYYRAADVLAMPTRYDIWGLVVGEAMAQALPVVASDRCGSALEMINHGANGLIVPSESIERLAEALENVLRSNSGTRELMAKSALIMARRHTIEEMVHEHMALVRQQVRSLT